MRNTAPKVHSEAATTNVTPIWLLPFWRLVKGEARGNFAAAWRALPRHLPNEIRPPSIEELAYALYDHGLV